jgi:hypothetical protein
MRSFITTPTVSAYSTLAKRLWRRAPSRQCLRLAASALVRAGIEPQTLSGLRDLCTPQAFRQAIEQMVAMHGGVYSTVVNVAHVLRKVAKRSGLLSQPEMEAVEEAHQRLR